MFSRVSTVEIQFGDCDPAGIVYYPNYFRFFDNATAALFSAALGMSKRGWLQRFDIAGIPMVDTGATYLKPCRFGDLAEIETSITELGQSSFSVRHVLRIGSEIGVEAHEKRVWAAYDGVGGIRAMPLPDDVRKALSGA